MPDVETTRRGQRHGPGFQRVTLVIFGINFILQLPTVFIGCFNSEPKVLYSSILLALSYVFVLPWIIELVPRWEKERVASGVPLHSSSPTSNKPFFSIANVVGLSAAVCQSISTTVNLVLLVRHSNTQIKISPLVAFFALGQLAPTFWPDADQTKTDQTDSVPLNPIGIDSDIPPRSKYPKSPTVTQDSKETCWRVVPCCSQITIEQRFAIANFIIELSAIVLDQVSFEPKILHAMILMLLSIVALFLYFIEFVYKAQCCKQRNKGLWTSPNNPSSILEFAGLSSVVLQPIFTVVNYVLARRHGGELQISVLPIPFALGLACYKFQDGRLNNIEPEDEENKGSVMNGHLISVITPPRPSHGVNRRVNGDDRVPLETESEGSAVEDDEIHQRVVMTPRVIEDDWVPLETESEGSAVQDARVENEIGRLTAETESLTIAGRKNKIARLIAEIGNLVEETARLTAQIKSSREAWVEYKIKSSIEALEEYMIAEIGRLIAEIERRNAEIGRLTAEATSWSEAWVENKIGGLIAEIGRPIAEIGRLTAETKSLSETWGENMIRCPTAEIEYLTAEIGLLAAEIFERLTGRWTVETKFLREARRTVETMSLSEARRTVETKSLSEAGVEKKKESAWLKKRELMREPTRRNVVNGLRRRVRSGR